MARATSKRLISLVLGIIIATAIAPPPRAQTPSTAVFDIPQTGVSFSTGDTWTQNGQTMRLYGVQSCIRGTSFTNQAGVKTDCGEASLAYLAALVRDARPQCAPVAQVGQQPAILVVCSAHVGATTLDLGTILITEGFAFAAFSNDAKPVYMPYLIAELVAKKNKAGLWAAPDMPHPNLILFGALKGEK
jgi:endonuclease YncB( thermonuclease family)